MRRILVHAAVAAMLVAALPSAASAQPPTRFSDHRLNLSCEADSPELGHVTLGLGVSQDFTGAGLAFWAPGSVPFESDPALVSDESEVIGSVESTELDVTLQMYTFEPEFFYGEPAGQAVVSLTLTPDGDPESFTLDSTNTNARFRSEEVHQPLAVEGSVSLPDGTTFDLSECMAVRSQITVFATNPNAFVSRYAATTVSCEWFEELSSVSMWAVADSGGGMTQVFVADSTGFYFGSGSLELNGRGMAAQYELFSGEGEQSELPVGSATASATLTASGEREQFVDRFENVTIKRISQRLTVDGSLTLTTPAGTRVLPMDGASCSASADRELFRAIEPGGPGGGGRPLPNDDLQGAEPIAIGEAVSVKSTTGTAEQPELPCMDESGGEAFIGHTAWWTFTGTGDPVTVDTAGSDFDTVVGIYVVSEAGPVEPVACVDDVFDGMEVSVQAAVTVGTDAGATYYVQAGGFAGQTGRLELSLQ
jgi:hypothetical protein